MCEKLVAPIKIKIFEEKLRDDIDFYLIYMLYIQFSEAANRLTSFLIQIRKLEKLKVNIIYTIEIQQQRQ